MADQFEPIPNRTQLVDNSGYIGDVWQRFLDRLFGNFEKRIRTLEAQGADHETRITALEP